MDDLSGRSVQNLLSAHLAGMQSNSPPESVNALDAGGLKAPDITVWSVWENQALMGIGALKELSSSVGEIKSMRTDPAHVRKGVAGTLLLHIISVAMDRGYRCLSLETGSGTEFEPALALYRKHGFANGIAFGGYTETRFNQFLHLKL
ncbi:MAG: GNAT family N-acetyltransferase [Parasphingorhabdus sp.]|uniref:GNAT family N-acetyltransferase n=1 Tax=Parasphingorhabdus sp. TaxID=2709688 RepID=UPI0032651375